MAKPYISPWRVVMFGLAIGAGLVLVSLIPTGKWSITASWSLKWPQLHKLLQADSTTVIDMATLRKKEISDSLALVESLASQDSLVVMTQNARQHQAAIHFPEGQDTLFHSLFRAMEKAKTSELVRIMHYGDSQIEIDRLTEVVREGLQQKFGGGGPGLQPPLQVIPSGTVKQTNTGPFRRFAIWSPDSVSPGHRRYGPLLNFTLVQGPEAQVQFSPGFSISPKARNYSRIKILVGQATEDVTIAVNGQTQMLSAAQGFQSLSFDVAQPGGTLSISFSTTESGSFELYGFSLESKQGVVLDNLPMRGCSGTIFTRVDQSLLFKGWDALGTDALWLEFGGNAVPSIESQAEAGRFARSFEQQLKMFRKYKPNLPILVIGPSDMSTRIEGSFQPYPFLDATRDSLKAAAFRQGCAYFDMIEAMGGLGAMPAWVKESPPLAGGDYIHFTPAGAKKMGDLLLQSFLREFNLYTLRKKKHHAS
jgi:hypothetical protein